MKKIFLTLCVALASIAMYAAGLDGVRIYINPGHGSWGPNDRPMATIPYPALESGRPDTCGFYESNTNLWKCLELGRKLEEAGADVEYSRTQNGPYPYVAGADDAELYNRSLSEISAEVEEGNFDYFISVHSNAATDGTATNYPLLLYRGLDNGTDKNGQSIEIAHKIWPYLFEAMNSGIDPYSNYSIDKVNIRGDIDFYKNNPNMQASDKTYPNGKTYRSSLGALKHGAPGMLSEGYFHTYQPARHRALNQDYCKQEGIRYYRGLAAWFEHAPETKGYIMGTVKDEHEKIVHDLFKYSAKTNDQWLPCNGAVVKLLKGGLEIAEYTVDNNYNGLFYFPDLDPGLYTLEISCEGYKELAEKYKEPIVVEANKTTYPMVFLENVNYVPDEIVYEDYPDQALEGVKFAAAYDMEYKGEQAFLIEGKVKRTIGLGDSTIVLSHTEDKVAHLYLIDHLTGNISTISTKGIVADTENAGEYLALSDIAYTSDGKLIGCNYIRNQYDGTSVDAGQKRGVSQIYKWEKLSGDPAKWVTSQNSGNFSRAEVGYTMTVSGPSKECTVYLTAVTNASTKNMRFVAISISDNYPAISYTQSDPQTACSGVLHGDNHLLQLSPLNPKENIIIDGELGMPMELDVVTGGKTNTIVAQATADYGVSVSETNFIKYAGRYLLVTPYTNTESKIAGVRVYDVTDGLDKAVLVRTNTDLDIPVEAEFAAATLAVNGATWTAYLFVDNKVITFAEAEVEIKPASHLNAYASSLQAKQVGNAIEFSYFLNAPVNAAEVTLTNADTDEKVTFPLTGLTQGAHTQSIDISALADGGYEWSLTVHGDVVTEVSKDFLTGDDTFDFYQPRGFASDRNPKSPHFGQLYITNSLGTTKSGYFGDEEAMHVFNPSIEHQGTYKGGVAWGSGGGPHRLFIDKTGLVYASNWSSTAGGIYIMDPANPTANFKSFFDPAQRNKTYTRITGFDIYGEGADRKLIASDGITYDGTLGQLGALVRFDIGETSENFAGVGDTLLHKGGGLANQHNTVLYDGRGGYWVCQNRGQKDGFQFLAHFTAEGTKDYNANTDGLDISRSDAGAMALNDDKTLLAMSADRKIIVYTISWGEDGKPSLKKKYETPELANNMTGVTFDYAGNLITGSLTSERIYAFATPTDGVVTTPAREEITITKLAATAATALEISATTLTLVEDETATLTATPTPADVVGLVYTWTSDNEAVATVVNGVVTAVAPGEATITVSATNDAMEAPLTQTCVVTVTETAATSVTLSQKAATLYAGDQIRLGYEIAPANATKPEITWTSSAEAVATVVDGIVTAVAPGETKIAIAIKNNAMAEAVTDTCVITVAEYVAVSGVTLSLTDTLVAKDATFTLVETIAPEGAMEVLKLWSSDNTAVATVVDGVVTAVGAGEANISLRVKSEKSDAIYEATCKVKVMVAVNAAMINEKEVTIIEGETAPLTLQYAPKDATGLTIKWISSNEEVATVVDGVVTAVAPGEVEITVSLQNAVMAEPVVTAPCKVIVEKKLIPITSVTLSVERDTLIVGNELTLEATIVAPEEAPEATITWTSDKPEVATVVDGVVTAVAEGEAIITVSVINADMTEALTATCTIVVEKDPTTGLLTIETAGIYYSMETIHNPQGLALQVYNLNGQLVATGNGDINMSATADGLYIVRCQAGTLKFIK